MPKIDEAPAATPAAKKSVVKKPKKQPKERAIVHPVPMAVESWGENAITPDKAKELLGWEEETEDVKFGADYHITDLKGVKIRLRNSTHNRPFSRALADVYVQELLNKRWQLNGETIVIGKYGEVISGQHRLGAVVLAEQQRAAEARWEENWGEGPVMLQTFAAVGVEETDDVVNTVDTGRPRSLSDTIYRSEWFSHLPPKERAKASRACDWAIRLVQLRIGVKDAFNPKKSHGANLEFLDKHKTLAKIVDHVCSEDKGGNVSNLVTPGYASAICYLMAASKTEPEQYVLKSKEGDRREKYLDLGLLERAKEFWSYVGKEGDPQLKAVRERIKLYAKRKDSTGEPIPVSLDEKIAIMSLAWTIYADGGTPTVAQVTPKYDNGHDGDDPSLLKGDYRLGGIDLGDEYDGEPADNQEGETSEGEPEPNPVEDRKETIKKAKEARDAKKAEMAAAEPPSNGKAQSPADEIRAQFAPIAKERPGKIVFIKSRSSGGLTCIDEDAKAVAKALGSPATKDPSGFTRFSVGKAEIKEKLTKLIDAGLHVVIAEQVPTGKLHETTTKVTEYTGE